MLDFSKFKGKKVKCAGVGEVLFDVFPTGPKIGGAPANFAYHCRQNGLEAIAISSVGNDELGYQARNLLAARFLPALLMENSKETGAVKVSLSADGVPTYTFVEDTAYDNIPLTDTALGVARQLDLMCFGSLAQRGSVSHKTIMALLDVMPKGALRVFDVNLRRTYYSREIIEDSLKRTDIFKCNEDELPVLCELAGLENSTAEAYYDYLKSNGIYCFIFTEGAVQSTVYLNDEVSVLPTPKVDAVDTVGAGDSFTATLVSRLMQGDPLKKAHEKAVKISAYVCTQAGAMPDMPAELFL
ncbi:MAG: carbohydrate kinase [Succinivibrio sp.]|nr:carbohydrate kinase [Succinivibrio sp.]